MYDFPSINVDVAGVINLPTLNKACNSKRVQCCGLSPETALKHKCGCAVMGVIAFGVFFFN